MPLTPDDPRLTAFLRGRLVGEELASFRRLLARDPALQQELRRLITSDEETVASLGPDATTPLGRPLAPTLIDEDPDLALGPVIGQGGMAVVHSATQLRLGREVAVKSVRPGMGADARHALEQEARVTGFLEHPAIVPVHDLLGDARGDPRVVLKRIEGQPWTKLLAAPEEVQRRFEREPLEWHVSVAINVCQALQFAHERGVVHRDVKPANVMIGSFGEVYLLDWGVAATMKPDPKGLLPCLLDGPFAGTLTFMAPEQLVAEGPLQGPWTDTYLVGGCLFQALYGKAPFAGIGLEGRLRDEHALPKLPAQRGAPPELAGIVRKALSPHREDRYETADALRRALVKFLAHSDARRLLEQATKRAEDARAAWGAEARQQGERAAADADFAFRAALELWPENQSAVEQRAALASDRVRYAVAHGAAQAASYLLDTLPAPHPTLSLEINEAVERDAKERKRLEQLAWESDRRFGLRSRRWLLGAFGLAWLGFWLTTAWAPPPTPVPMLTFLALCLTLGTVAVLPLRRVFLDHRRNREMLLVNVAMVVASLAMAGAGLWLHLPVEVLLVMLMLVWSLGMGAVAVIVEPASLVPAVVWLLAALASAWSPSLTRGSLAAGTLVHVAAPLIVSLRVRRDDGAQSTARR